jgi:hypothetical protein
MAAAASTGDQSGNYLGLMVACTIIAVIFVIAAVVWIRFHGY